MTQLRQRYPALLPLLLILVIAAVLRFVALDRAPTGGHGDVAWLGINALDWVDRGIVPFYVREMYAPEFFPVYLTGLLLPLTGVSYLPLRIITATMGVLFVALLYPATGWLLGEDRPAAFKRRAGLLAALAGAVSLHVIGMQRLGMESPPFITVVVLLTGLTARAWWSERFSAWRWVLAGVALALAQYVYLPARFLPFVLALWIAHGIIWQRRRFVMHWRGWLVMGVVSLVLTLPAILLFLRSPDAFSARADLGTAVTGGWIWNYDTSAYGGIVGLMAQKLGQTLGGIGLSFDGEYAFMNAPLLGPVFVVGLLIAVVMFVRRFRWIAYAWPLLAIPILLLPDLISGGVPGIHALHQMGIVPFVIILAGVGLAHVWDWRTLHDQPALSTGLAAVVAALAIVPAIVGMNHYLTVVVPNELRDPNSSWSRAQTDVDLGQRLIAQPETAYLLPYSEYTRSALAWIIAGGFRERRSAIDADGWLRLPDPPDALTVVYTEAPERLRHDGHPAHFDPRLWVLLYDNTVWLLPPLTEDQTAQVTALRDGDDYESLIDRSDTLIARLYPMEDAADLFAPRMVVDAPLGTTFGGEVRLRGYSLPSPDLTPGQGFYVTLYWTPVAPISDDDEIIAQIWNDEGVSLAGAHDFPYGGMYRARIWRMDETVPTHHWLDIPQDLPFRRYSLIAALEHLLGEERLPVTADPTDADPTIARAATLRHKPPDAELGDDALAEPISFGDLLAIRALTVTADGQALALDDDWTVAPGSTLTFDLVWEAEATPDADYSLFVHVTPAADAPPQAQLDAVIGGDYPTGAWRAGDRIAQQVTLTLPDDLAAGRYQVRLGVYHWATGARLPVGDGDAYAAGTVVVR
ncbi:MAG: hypothetical protein IT320_03990 [Anaerolineae bacterium]|nr:hypothetical protein [Anaerolineae bacterium]